MRYRETCRPRQIPFGDQVWTWNRAPTRLKTLTWPRLKRGLRHIQAHTAIEMSTPPVKIRRGSRHIARGSLPSSSGLTNLASNRSPRARSGLPAAAAAKSAITVDRSRPCWSARSCRNDSTGSARRAVTTRRAPRCGRPGPDRLMPDSPSRRFQKSGPTRRARSFSEITARALVDELTHALINSFTR